MPMGLTGAPYTFCEAVVTALGEMLGRELENWMDNIAFASDSFEENFGVLTIFLSKRRAAKLSITPSKMKLFQKEFVFARARLSQEGVKPNLDKVAVVIDFPRPETIHDAMWFTGLTNWFRHLIKDYGKIAQPLTDLTRNAKKEAEAEKRAREAKHGKKPRKGNFKRFLKETHLGLKWTQECEDTFFKLQLLITSEPVLWTPVYDRRPFRVITDGCAKGFGVMLEQEFMTTMKDGSIHRDWHSIAFCSKQTSRSEERYEPFLLEFAALKFVLDKFADLTFGSPIMLVTDCRALRDWLVSERLNTTHAQWQQFILSH